MYNVLTFTGHLKYYIKPHRELALRACAGESTGCRMVIPSMCGDTTRVQQHAF